MAQREGAAVSIMAYVGLPGSGKSYSVVELQILPAMRKGRTVVTNIPLVAEEWAALNLPGKIVPFVNEEIRAEPERIMEYATAGVILIWDEIQLCLPQGLTADKVPDVYKKLFSEHRHMVDAQGQSTQIVFVTQSLGNVAKFARELVENTFVTTKLSFVGLSKTYRVDVYHGCVTGCTPNPNKALRQLGGRYRPEIYKLYKSHTMSESGTLGADEKKMDGRANILLRPVFLIGIVVCPLLIIFSLRAFSANFHGLAMKSKAAPAVNGSPAPEAGAQRSGATVSAPAVPHQPAALNPVPVLNRVLFAVYSESGNDVTVAYMAIGERVEQLVGSDLCRRVAVHTQCQWRGKWYDEAGELRDQVTGPVGAWSLASR